MQATTVKTKRDRAATVASCDAGTLVLRMLDLFESRGVSCVYLRNYESLPGNVGHDVDLLVAPGRRRMALSLLRAAATDSGWQIVRIARFSPLSVFLIDSRNDRVLHVDLFDRIERHWLSFGSARRILAKAFHNGMVTRPDVGDEVFLNVCTRLVYHGIVREKHRLQAGQAIAAGLAGRISEAFQAHLGPRLGTALADRVRRDDWQAVVSLAPAIRLHCLLRWGLGSPCSSFVGLSRYVYRTIGRILRPPGPFVVLVGADGVGKSAVIQDLAPFLDELTGIGDALRFHWKPERRSLSSGVVIAGPPENPRSRPPRGRLASLLFLAFHIAGFWTGWLSWLLPAMAKDRAVVGDRYALDIFLDPRRFRLSLPGWVLFAASRIVPPPDLVVGLVADPAMIADRKAELPANEIAAYQERLRMVAGRWRRIRIVDAGGSLDEVRANVRAEVVSRLQEQLPGLARER